jgi:hypothetical protein
MEPSYVFMIATIVPLLAIGMIFLLIKKRTRSSPLTFLSIVFVSLSIVFSDARPATYGFIGIGVILALVDMAMKKSKRKGVI